MKNLILLPYYFKNIGITILCSIPLLLLAFHLIEVNMLPNEQILLNQLLIGFATLAMFFLNFYKRKNEDDTWVLKRLHCLFFSIFLGINFYILNAVLNLISSGDFYDLGAELLFFILLFNLVQLIAINKRIVSNDKDSLNE